MGDFNSRTTSKLDYIKYDSDNYIPLYDNYIPDEQHLPSRSNQDKKSNNYGNQLIDLCTATGLRILNGRKLGDITGKFTCFQYHGRSVVDYAIANRDIFNMIEYFKVHSFRGDISDHCKISLQLNNQNNTLLHKQTHKQNKTALSTQNTLPTKYYWDTSSPIAFTKAMESTEISNIITTLNENLKHNIVNIDETVNQFTNILIKAADIACIKKRTNKPKSVKIKRVQKKWYDKSCAEMKRELIKLGTKMQCNSSNHQDDKTKFYHAKKNNIKSC